MDVHKVRSQVELILSQVRSRPSYVVVPTEGGGGAYFEAEASAPPVALPGAFQMSHEQLHLLRRLYISLPAELQSMMPTIVMGQMATAPLVVTHALIDLRAMNL